MKSIILPNDTEHKLIESIYDVTIDLDKFLDLLVLLEDEFMQTQINHSAQEGKQVSKTLENLDPIIAGHVSKAFTILEMTQPSTNSAPNLRQLVDVNPLPTFILSDDKLVVTANKNALRFFNIKANKPIPDNAFITDDILKIEQCLATLETAETDRILTVIQPQNAEGEATLLFALSKIYDVKTSANYLKISAVHTQWNSNVANAIQKSFKLTDAELDIARRFVAGEKISDMAEIKQRSINTLRTQAKSLLRKTKLKTQSELVRLFSALQNLDMPNVDEISSHVYNNQASNLTTLPTNNSKLLNRPHGRKLYYEIYGNPHGQPVLFSHGVMSGTRMSQDIIGYLYAQNIKLIAPHRAGFGKSDPYLNNDEADNFIADIKALLAAEQVDKFKIIGQFVGSYYAYQLANEMPERIIKMRMINGQMPVVSRAQLVGIKYPQHVAVYATRYLPQLLPFLIRIVGTQIKKFGTRHVLDVYFKNSDFDRQLCLDDEIGNIAMDSFTACYTHGEGYLQQEFKQVYQVDWSHLIANLSVPVELFHATDDIAMPLWQVEDWAAKYPHLELTAVKGGQLILYKYPEKTLKNL